MAAYTAGVVTFGAVVSNVTPKRAMLRCLPDGVCFTSLRATSNQDWPFRRSNDSCERLVEAARPSGQKDICLMDGYIDLKKCAEKASISVTTLRAHLHEIKHTRLTPRGKILLKWADVDQWLESRARAVKNDEDVMLFLKELAS